MKGPMITQSLRGMGGTEPFHWRGDRANLSAFNGAFVTLMGRATTLPDSEMSAFNDFVMPLVYPPNPGEYLDRTQPDAPPGTPSSLRGQTDFTTSTLDGPLRCSDCHTEANFAPGTNHIMIPAAALEESQDLKVPQLRNEYKKTGFNSTPGSVNRRGFGYTHDGAQDNLFDFLHFQRFSFADDAQRQDMAAYLMTFDTGTAPAVGYQITFDGTNNEDAETISRMDTLEAQAAAGNCDLIAKGRLEGIPRGWEFVGGVWNPDKTGDPSLSSADLRALAGLGTELTVTGVPSGSGHRMGVDRDRDGYLDADELALNCDPGNPLINPSVLAASGPRGVFHFGLRAVRPNPFHDATVVDFSMGRRGRVNLAVYDVMGRQVRSLARGLWLDPGPQSLRWDGRSESGATTPVGVYFVRLETEAGQWSRPVVRIR
jgi:hypothetical protein